MKADTEVGLVLVFTVAAFSVGQMVSVDSAKPFFDYFVIPLITLAAAYGGSSYAFKLQENRAKQETDSKNVKAANQAIFELIRAYNKLLAIRKQFISPFEQDSYRHHKIPPTAGMTWKNPEFDYDALAFLFESKDPNLLGTLSLVEQEVSSTYEVIRHRSSLHYEQFQPAVERVSKIHGETVSAVDVEAELGPRNSYILKMLTDMMIVEVDNCIQITREHVELLYAGVKEMYPTHRVLTLAN